MEGFFACPSGALVVVPGAALVVVECRVPVVLVADARDARGVARVVGASAAGRVVKGRFVVVVVGAMDGLEVVFPGEARVAAPAVPGALRTVVLLFSSPEVTDDKSGSASDAADRDASVVLRAAEPGTGRVGGLFRLDPVVLTRDVELVGGLDALAVEARALLAVTVGRRAPAGAVPAVEVVGRRGGIASLVAEPAFEAILRRTEDVGVEGAGNFFRSGLPAWGVLDGGCSLSLAGVGASMAGHAFQGYSAQNVAMLRRCAQWCLEGEGEAVQRRGISIHAESCALQSRLSHAWRYVGEAPVWPGTASHCLARDGRRQRTSPPVKLPAIDGGTRRHVSTRCLYGRYCLASFSWTVACLVADRWCLVRDSRCKTPWPIREAPAASIMRCG
jgi:hypothetical protein